MHKPTEMEKSVDRGAAWLDKNRPGWEFKIDLGELNLSGTSCCVLGQVDGNFWTSLHLQAEANDESSFDEMAWAEERGFYVPRRETEDHSRVQARYNQLTDVWRTLIKDRFDRGVFSDLGGLVRSPKQGD